MLSTTPPRESHPLESSSCYSASNPQPIAKNASAVTPSINYHSTTAIMERPVPGRDTFAEGTLPNDGFDEMYDDSRQNSPEVNAGPVKGLPALPPFQESNVRSEPLISPPNTRLVDTNPPAPTSGTSGPRTRPVDRITPAPYSSINTRETTSIDSSDEPWNLTPWPRTISPVASRQLEIAATSSNRIPNNATDAWTVRPYAAAGSSNKIPDGAKIVDVDAWEVRRRIQVTHQPSDLSPQASSRTLSGSEQTAVDFLISNSHSRDISRGPSGSRTGSNAKYENGNPFAGPGIERWLHVDIETAIREKFDDQLGAALLCIYAKDCHKQDEIRKGKQIKGEAPLSPLFPSIENNTTIETESSDEDEAKMEYIYNVRPHTLMSSEAGVRTIKAHPGNAVWQLVQSRLGSLNDSRKWETACHNCSTIIDSQMAHLCPSCTEERERTISPEEAAVVDNKNQTEGAALALASGQATGQATGSQSRSRVARKANGNVNSNANGTQTRPSPAPLPPSRPSRRTRRPTASEPEDLPPAPAPAVSLRRRSHRERVIGRVSASTPDQAQAFGNNKTEGANNVDDEQGRRGGKAKKSVSWDPKENGQTNRKRKASDAVENVGGGRIRACARRRRVSDSSNGSDQLEAAQQNQRGAASCTLAAGAGTGFGAGTSSSGRNLATTDLVAAHAPDPVAYSTSPSTLASFPATPPRREASSGRPGRLTLRVAPETNPEHPDHGAYLMRRELDRRM